jgi:hypothetical protein
VVFLRGIWRSHGGVCEGYLELSVMFLKMQALLECLTLNL